MTRRVCVPAWLMFVLVALVIGDAIYWGSVVGMSALDDIRLRLAGALVLQRDSVRLLDDDAFASTDMARIAETDWFEVYVDRTADVEWLLAVATAAHHAFSQLDANVSDTTARDEARTILQRALDDR